MHLIIDAVPNPLNKYFTDDCRFMGKKNKSVKFSDNNVLLFDTFGNIYQRT